MNQNFTIQKEEEGTRIDKYIAEQCDSISRSYIQKLIKEDRVFVNDKIIKANYQLTEGDVIVFDIPEPEEPNIQPEDIPLTILYEDSDLLVIDKPKNTVVHPSAGHYTNTLVNAVMFHCQGQLSGINGVLRPGIVHRIDKDTTGALIICKNDFSHNNIAEQLKAHSITRKYRAIVTGNFKEESGTVDAPIGRHPKERKKMAVNYKNGKVAVTHYQVLEQFKNYSYIECQLETGRTHQIRVHMAHIGHPLLGDTVYGSTKTSMKLEGQTLHAMVIGFLHPRTGEYLEFTSPLPDYFVELLDKFNKTSC